MRGFSPRRKCLLSEPLTQPSWLSAAELPSPTRGEGIAIGIVGNSLLTIPLAQQILGEVGERRARQRGEWQRAGDVDGGEAEPRREQSIEHAFAEPLREFCRDAVAEHLRDQGVA